MNASAKTKLIPWNTPNFVLGEMVQHPLYEGLMHSPKWAIEDCEPEILADMCDEFRKEIFKRARKRDPALNRD